MGEWLLGIVGIICLGLLLEIVLPDGQTTKYVRGAFSLLVIFAVISPLPKLFGGEVDFALDKVDYSLDNEFLSKTSYEYKTSLETNLEKLLQGEGYDTTVNIVIKKGSVKDVEVVSVKIHFSGISDQEMNTHISKVQEIVAKCTGVTKSKIVVGVENGSG